MNYQIMRKARKMAKITQDELAALLGINRATVSKYETGAIEPSITQQMKISQILGIDIFQLIDDESIEAYFAVIERKRNVLHDSGMIIDKEGASAPVDTFVGHFMKTTENLSNEGKMDLLMISDYFAEIDQDDRKQALRFMAFLSCQPKYRKDSTEN